MQNQTERRKSAPELAAIYERLDKGDQRFAAIEEAIATNTELTREIQRNTAGFVAFSEDLERGTRFLCRCAKGVDFILRRVDRYWKPVLICIVVISWALNGFVLPAWALEPLKRILE